jgi:hypothetical protein
MPYADKARERTNKSWKCMLVRCYDERNEKYAIYGAKGITVCDRWRGKDGFNNFVEDMGLRPAPDATCKRWTLDRIDRTRGYEPDNCRWATPHEQNANRPIEQMRATMSANRRGKKMSPERRERHAARMSSDDVRAKLSVASKALWASEDYRTRNLNAR